MTCSEGTSRPGQHAEPTTLEGGPGLALGDAVMLKTLCRALTAWMKHLRPRVRLPGKSLNAPNGAHVPVTLRPSLRTYRGEVAPLSRHPALPPALHQAFWSQAPSALIPVPPCR